ncbi:MAG: bifunctional DNA-formamidopyrimidine glycosylase/DNA-(apurinic or apyrimidinic site) lyase [Bacilli bacterium]|nr:bifunctional DNA-formamidopyrimidine glycosylase/DNA-(apurinic or apyrimidinic site) lyase [Bacilli bacterium]
MPELPEVETIKNVLKPIVVGNIITKIDVLRDSTILGDKDTFVKSLIGKAFTDVTRYGKYLFFHLTKDLVIISHLRMEGKYYQLEENEPNTYFSRVVFHLNNGYKICYDDSRCFGILKLSTESDYKQEPEIVKLGQEPFYINDVQYLLNKSKNSNIPVKTTITDQTLIAGIGNIYADEILFDCKIHPLTPCRLITKQQWVDIIYSARKILKEAIRLGGSTIKSYHPGKNIDGKFQSSIKAYGRYGEVCPNCGTAFRFIKVGGRGTTFCPNCQKKLGKPLRIALIGKVAAGKSTVLDVFKSYGADIFICDNYISDLYKTKEVASKIAKLFSLDFKDEVDKKILRQHLVNNPKDIKKLQSLIYPIVSEKVSYFFKHSKAKFAVCEAPLLFEANMENMFDEIIAVDIDEKVQLERLLLRNPDTGKFLKQLSDKNNSFEKNKKKANIIISNNASQSELINETKNIINEFLCRPD